MPQRPLGSKKHRPCDYCRRQKRSCHIDVLGGACTDCKARALECTFNKPPLMRPVRALRNTRPKETSQYSGQPTGDTARSAASDDPTLLSTLRGIQLLSLSSQNADDNANESEDDSYYDSLDLECDDLEESHYVGTKVLFNSVSTRAHEDGSRRNVAELFRDVSVEKGRPAIFVKNPALVYGREDSGGAFAYRRAVELVGGQEMASSLIELFKQRTLPAFPIVNRMRLEASMRLEPGAGAFPAVFLSCAIAHAANSYVPALQHCFKPLWSVVLTALDHEYRQPRLQTLQTALLALFGGPHINIGQHGISIARALGCAHLLGLHIDSDSWRLPRWERSVRKRIWWMLFIHDKWRACVYGRPSVIDPRESTCDLPTLRHSDWGTDADEDERQSMLSFIALCSITLILHRILDSFCSVHATENPLSITERFRVLSTLSGDLDDIAAQMDETIKLPLRQGISSTVGGVRAMQLCYLGLKLIIIDHTFETTSLNSSARMACTEAGLQTATSITDFLDLLREEDIKQYWMPYSFHNIYNVATFLIRTAQSDTSSPSSDHALSELKRFAGIVSRAAKSGWQPAITARFHIIVSLSDLDRWIHATEIRMILENEINNQNSAEINIIDPSLLVPS